MRIREVVFIIVTLLPAEKLLQKFKRKKKITGISGSESVWRLNRV